MMMLRRLVLMVLCHTGRHGVVIVRTRLAGKHRRHGKRQRHARKESKQTGTEQKAP